MPLITQTVTMLNNNQQNAIELDKSKIRVRSFSTHLSETDISKATSVILVIFLFV